MRVKFWGTRGSVPVPGPATIRYGGNTTCVEVEGRDGTLIIIDAGTGIRALGDELSRRGVERPVHVIMTHYHWDHIQGWPFFGPTYNPKSEIIIHGRAGSKDKLSTLFGHQMVMPYFPVEFGDLPASFSYEILKEKSFEIGELHIQTIELCHPGKAFGLRISEQRKAFVLMTDHEFGLPDKLPHSYADYVKFAQKAQLLVHDAQFSAEELDTHRGWGHSSYEEALKFALDAKAVRMALFHHAPTRIDYEIDRFVTHCNRIADERRKSIDVFGMMEGMEFSM